MSPHHEWGSKKLQNLFPVSKTLQTATETNLIKQYSKPYSSTFKQKCYFLKISRFNKILKI